MPYTVGMLLPGTVQCQSPNQHSLKVAKHSGRLWDRSTGLLHTSHSQHYPYKYLVLYLSFVSLGYDVLHVWIEYDGRQRQVPIVLWTFDFRTHFLIRWEKQNFQFNNHNSTVEMVCVSCTFPTGCKFIQREQKVDLVPPNTWESSGCWDLAGRRRTPPSSHYRPAELFAEKEKER